MIGETKCHDVRLALGVYVVGVIDPAERGLVDAHLSGCPACREELAALAGLPALLSRVPRREAELAALVAREGGGASASDEPPPELLGSLLQQVAARRQVRGRRLILAAAAAVVIAAGGGAALDHGLAPAPAAVSDVAFGTSPVTRVSAVVDYSAAARGTSMRVRVSGIRVGAACDFWVVTAAGKLTQAGHWTISRSYGAPPWYPASSPVTAAALRGFEITSGRRVLIQIPAR